MQLLDALTEAAVAAGREVCRIYETGFEVEHKTDESPVTAADHAAEAIILERLAKLAPDVPVVAEEQVAAGHVPVVITGRAAFAQSSVMGETQAAERLSGSEGYFFLVDPLDGTKEFVQRRGDFTVNIALVRNGRPVLGVVYAPARKLLFAGDVTARAAFRSEQSPAESELALRRPIGVRDVPATGIVAVASRSHSTPETDAYLARFDVRERVSVGSSLKFCLIAAGEADLYPRLGPTMEWDTAAGQAVLEAAGGQVILASGGPLRYGKPDFRNPHFIASGTLRPHPLIA